MHETFSFLYIKEAGTREVKLWQNHWLPLKDPEEDKQEASLADAQDISVNAATEVLNRTFTIKEEQKIALKAFLGWQRAFTLLPTGFGKGLCEINPKDFGSIPSGMLG